MCNSKCVWSTVTFLTLKCCIDVYSQASMRYCKVIFEVLKAGCHGSRPSRSPAVRFPSSENINVRRMTPRTRDVISDPGFIETTCFLLWCHYLFGQGQEFLDPTQVVEYKCGNRRKVIELRGGVGANWEVLTPSFRKLRSSPPKKRTVQPGDAFEDTNFKLGFEIVKF
jgi:hypothetical protein